MRTKTVELLNTYASPTGTYTPGTVVDLPAPEAAALIAGRYAKETTRKAAPETAEDPGAAEAETAEGVGRRRRR